MTNDAIRERIVESERKRSSRHRNKKKRSTKRTKDGQAALEVFHEHGYQAYLKTAWWKQVKRKRIFGKCRGCDTRPASQLHHTVYRLGCEDWHETIPICHDCHHLLHDKLSELFPELSRGKSAKFTREIWSNVFNTPWFGNKTAKPKDRHRHWKEKRVRWTKRCPPSERAEAEEKRQTSSLELELMLANRQTSSIPLAPNCATVRPTRKPCGALASKLKRLPRGSRALGL